MLPEPYRLHHHSDFSRTVRRGHRIGRRDIVVHALCSDADLRSGGPRIGLIVNKAVGNAVVRHRVARRLRHVCLELIRSGELPDSVDVVIRALPGTSAASSHELDDQLRSTVKKLVARFEVST